MIKYVTSPRLKRFRLLSPDSLMASLSKEKIDFDSLYFIGVIIMQKSKEYVLKNWYFEIKTKIQAGLGIFQSLEVINIYTGVLSSI